MKPSAVFASSHGLLQRCSVCLTRELPRTRYWHENTLTVYRKQQGKTHLLLIKLCSVMANSTLLLLFHLETFSVWDLLEQTPVRVVTFLPTDRILNEHWGVIPEKHLIFNHTTVQYKLIFFCFVFHLLVLYYFPVSLNASSPSRVKGVSWHQLLHHLPLLLLFDKVLGNTPPPVFPSGQILTHTGG